MKLTKTKLKQLIKEELNTVLNEKTSPMGCAWSILSKAMDQLEKNCGVLAFTTQTGGGRNKEPDAYTLTVKPKSK
jgi:hypothetical protein